jgi:hypothetical protein
LEEVVRSFYKAITQRYIRQPLYLLMRANLRKLWRHKNMFDDRMQDISVELIGSGDGHDCRE